MTGTLSIIREILDEVDRYSLEFGPDVERRFRCRRCGTVFGEVWDETTDDFLNLLLVHELDCRK